MTVTIRRATPDDLGAIIVGAEAFAEQSGIRPLMAEDIGPTVAGVVGLPAFRVYLAECNGLIVGGLGVSVMPFLWNMDLIEMSEHFFWIYDWAPKVTALAMLRRVLADVEAEKINIVTFAKLKTSPAKLERVYELLGFVRTQESYVRVFQWP